jgi:hypothetical protein
MYYFLNGVRMGFFALRSNGNNILGPTEGKKLVRAIEQLINNYRQMVFTVVISFD